ncbi:PREDICTED: pentatricopeptide repeat-containing protein At2g35130-like, partial [Nicotiana attenuata]|uniref:pentatricopeptide repeat-containing protein At2g35130-like n=1 Tax=Nicotiana attenuata TaxID=49451 RepID=UPI000905B500
MLVSRCPLNHILFEPRISKGGFRWKAKDSNNVPIEKWKQDSIFIDRRGRFRHFDHKKVSRKRCGSLRGRGWKYGSGFVDGIFPVLSPIAQQILTFVKKERDPERIWSSLDTLRPTNDTWDDIINVAVQLRINKQWDLIILVKIIF